MEGRQSKDMIIHASNSGQQTFICLWEIIKKNMDISVFDLTDHNFKAEAAVPAAAGS